MGRRKAGNSGAHDAGFLARDARERVAEIIAVIERDAADQTCARLRHDIGGVQPPAEPDFKNRRIGRVAGESGEGGGGRRLEKGQGARLAELRDLGQNFGKFFLFDQASCNTDAFMERDEVGRGVNMHALACRLQHRAKVSSGRTLAVGARDMENRRQLLVRIAKPRQQIEIGGAQSEIDIAPARAVAAETLEKCR